MARAEQSAVQQETKLGNVSEGFFLAASPVQKGYRKAFPDTGLNYKAETGSS